MERVKVKVVGDLLMQDTEAGVLWSGPCARPPADTSAEKQPEPHPGNSISDDITAEDTEPHVDSESGEWILSEWDVECIAIGAGVLGCGGGGHPAIGRLRTLAALRQGKQIRVISPARCARQMSLGDRVGVVFFFGALNVQVEKLSTGMECLTALACLMADKQVEEDYHESDGVKYTNGQVDPAVLRTIRETPSTDLVALASIEIGGINSTEPLIQAAELGIPVVDCDFMGRAFPEYQMCTSWMYGLPPYPVAFADNKGRYGIVHHGNTAKHIEDHMRKCCVDMGCWMGVALAHFDAETVCSRAVPHSLSRAWRLGRAVLRARRDHSCPVEAILTHEAGSHIGSGKIVDVERTTAGFVRGCVTIAGTGSWRGSTFWVEFQNENTVARRQDAEGQKQVVACVPDLLCLVDAECGEPVCTEDLRYGLRVSLLLLPSSSLLRTPQALAWIGPHAFGYDPQDVTFTPFSQMSDQMSVPLQ